MPKMTCDKCGKSSDELTIKKVFDWLTTHQCTLKRDSKRKLKRKRGG